MTDDLDLDDTLRRSISNAHRLRWVAVVVLAVVVLLAIGGFGYEVNTQQNRLTSSCAFYRELATIALPPPSSKAAPQSKLGIELVVNSRIAYTGQGCGRLPRPSPALAQYGRMYNIRIPS